MISELFTGGRAVGHAWLRTIQGRLHTTQRVASPLGDLRLPHLPAGHEVERDILDVFKKYRGEIDYTRAYRDGQRVDALELQVDGNWSSVLDVCRGNRVMLNICNLHREIPYLGEAASMISGALESNVRFDAFCSGPAMSATPVHYDYDNAFVMQAVGTKHWRCYDNLSDVHRHFGGYRVDQGTVGQKHFEKIMGPGDGIYIPGGTLHEAFTVGDSSIHFAIDLTPITPESSIGYLVRARVEDSQRGDAYEPYSAELARTTWERSRAALSAIQPQDLHEWHQRYLLWAAARYRRVSAKPYSRAGARGLKTAPGAWARLRTEGDEVRIDHQAFSNTVANSQPWTFEPAAVTLPAALGPLLESILANTNGGISVEDIDAVLDPDSTDLLAGALVQAGIVEVAA